MYGSYEGRFLHQLRFVRQCAISALSVKYIDGQSGDYALTDKAEMAEEAPSYDPSVNMAVP